MEEPSYNTQPGNWGVPKDLCQCGFDSFNDLATFEHASPVSLFASPLLYDAGLQGSGPTLGLLTAANQFAQQDPPFIASDTIHQSLVIHKDATVGPVRDGTPSSNSQGSSPSVEDRYLPRSAYTNSAKGKVSNRRGKRKDHSNHSTRLECGWKDCKRPRPFKTKGTLMRHIKTQHADP